ncbi:hypothetical protein K445DRAFT_304301 [Daldinia sp. EC12]|nr:hypothetical protein K445DRAFT_304301 [Daldinia sp. EC12]
MAVLEEVPGVKVTVFINGKDCLEYDDPDISEQQPSCPTSSKYIESHDDTEFTIRVIIDKDYNWGNNNHSLTFTAKMDSSFMKSRIYCKETLINGYCEDVFEGKDTFCENTSSWLCRRFKFSTVKTIENATKERLDKDLKRAKILGFIEIEIQRETATGNYLADTHTHDPPSPSFELAEKALKGKSLSHGTTLSAGTTIQRPIWTRTKSLPGENGPFAIFRFQYRSRKALQDEMIIPRTPSRSPTLDGLSAAEINRLAKERLRVINGGKELVKEESKGIKHERDEVIDLTKSDISTRPTKNRRLSEVIDLTDD